MSFNAILDLFKCIQSIKGKYPMIASHYKYLQRIAGNQVLEEKEIECFQKWLSENPKLPNIDQPFYKTKTTICFINVHRLASQSVIDEFETKLVTIDSLFYPTGRPVAATTTTTSDISPGAANAINEIRKNPALAGLMDDIQSTMSSVDISKDPLRALENKKVQSLIKNIQDGIKTGKIKIPELTTTIHSVVDSVKGELDSDIGNVLTTAVEMMKDAERGKQPDVSKIFQMLQDIK